MRFIIVFCGLLCVTPVRSLEVFPDDILFAYSSSPAPMPGMQSLGHTAYDTSGNAQVIRRESSVTFTKSELCSAAVSVAKANNLPIPFFTNLIQQESDFKPAAVSRAGAQGIAQFMPRVATWLGLADPLAPITALHASGSYLARLLAQFGNIGLAAAAYNAGPRRVQDWISGRGGLPAETRHYVQRITGRPVERWAQTEVDAEVERTPNSICAGLPDGEVRFAFETTKSVFPAAARSPAADLGVRREVPQRSKPARHSLPQPSQFAIGRSVPPAILASERAVIARWKLKTSGRTREAALH
jgi:hypothetical protein